MSSAPSRVSLDHRLTRCHAYGHPRAWPSTGAPSYSMSQILPGPESSRGCSSGSSSVISRPATLPSATVPVCSARSSAWRAVLAAAARASAGVEAVADHQLDLCCGAEGDAAAERDLDARVLGGAQAGGALLNVAASQLGQHWRHLRRCAEDFGQVPVWRGAAAAGTFLAVCWPEWHGLLRPAGDPLPSFPRPGQRTGA